MIFFWVCRYLLKVGRQATRAHNLNAISARARAHFQMPKSCLFTLRPEAIGQTNPMCDLAVMSYRGTPKPNCKKDVGENYYRIIFTYTVAAVPYSWAI